jgi:hypothetical protein
MMQYTQDYDENLTPAYVYQYGANDQRDYWFTILDPYMKSAQILKCPSAPASNTGPSYTAFVIGYNVAAALVNNPVVRFAGTYTKQSKLAQVSRPAESILLFENTYWDRNAVTSPVSTIWTSSSYLNPATYNWNANYPGRHLEGSNCLFTDGHVKWRRPESFKGRELVLNETPEAGWAGW